MYIYLVLHDCDININNITLSSNSVTDFCLLNFVFLRCVGVVHVEYAGGWIWQNLLIHFTPNGHFSSFLLNFLYYCIMPLSTQLYKYFVCMNRILQKIVIWKGNMVYGTWACGHYYMILLIVLQSNYSHLHSFLQYIRVIVISHLYQYSIFSFFNFCQFIGSKSRNFLWF